MKNKEDDLSEQTYNFFIWMLSGISLSKHRQELRSQNTNRYVETLYGRTNKPYKVPTELFSNLKKRQQFYMNDDNFFDDYQSLTQEHVGKSLVTS